MVNEMDEQRFWAERNMAACRLAAEKAEARSRREALEECLEQWHELYRSGAVTLEGGQ